MYDYECDRCGVIGSAEEFELIDHGEYARCHNCVGDWGNDA